MKTYKANNLKELVKVLSEIIDKKGKKLFNKKKNQKLKLKAMKKLLKIFVISIVAVIIATIVGFLITEWQWWVIVISINLIPEIIQTSKT